MSVQKVRVDGLRELEAALHELADWARGRRELRRAAARAQTQLLEAMRHRAMNPRRAGWKKDPALAARIQPATIDPRDGVHAVIVGMKLCAEKIAREVWEPAGRGGGWVGRMVRKKIAGAERRWHFREFGTRHHPADPFIRPLWDEHAPQLPAQFARGLQAQIKRIARKAAKTGA